MKKLAPLDNEIVFKLAFTDPTVLKGFVHAITGLEVEFSTIETEKRFNPKIGKIDFAYDIFAETSDHRAIIEIQRVEYDYHFDRFLHYHNMAMAELQRSSKEYKIDRTVYTIIILTEPYTVRTIDGIAVKDEILVSSVDPRTLADEQRKLFGHKLFFLNPNHKGSDTPVEIRNWLDFIYNSIHQSEQYNLPDSESIEKAASLIYYDELTPAQCEEMKIAEAKKAKLAHLKSVLEEEKQKTGEADRRAETEAKRAKTEAKRAESEAKRAEVEKQRAESEAKRAEVEKEKAIEADKRANSTHDAAVKVLIEMGLSEEEAQQKLK